MSLRTKFFIIVGVVIGFIVFVVIVLSGNKTEPAPLDTPPVSSFPAEPIENSVPERSSIVAAPPSTPAPAPVSDSERQLEALMRSFAERFGSFSNQSNFDNIRELRSLMTPTMQAWSERFIAESKNDATAPYYGITTRALTVLVSGMNEAKDEARVLVKTQRREVKGRETPRVFYQDLVLATKKVDGMWKVERGEWK